MSVITGIYSASIHRIKIPIQIAERMVPDDETILP